MIEIAFLACSLLDGSGCKDVSLQYHSEVPPSAFQCARYGEVAIAKWVVDNPNWSITRGYTCGPASKVVKL